jgi:hypothetical protein
MGGHNSGLPTCCMLSMSQYELDDQATSSYPKAVIPGHSTWMSGLYGLCCSVMLSF